MGDVALVVSGRPFRGWKTVRVRRSMETLSGAFSLSVSERFPGDPLERPIVEGSEASILLDGTPVLTGYVDELRRSFQGSEDGGEHSVTVAGRDKAGDLVDCAAVHEGGQWKGVGLEEIVRGVIAPFGISLAVETDVGAVFPTVQIQEGETAFELIARLCRMRGVLAISDGVGGLVLTRVGSARAGSRLVLGENLLAGSLTVTQRDRHSVYVVKGQQRGTDNLFGDAAAAPVGETLDPRILRYRPLTLIAEDQGDAAAMETRATWESNVRAGRSRRPSYAVQGWQHAGGVWEPNSLVEVDDPVLGVRGEFLIASVLHILGETEGTRTQLELALPDAFALEPLVPKSAKVETWSG